MRHYHLAARTASANCLWKELAREIETTDADTFVVSYENFLFRVNNNAKLLVESLLSWLDVEVVCHLGGKTSSCLLGMQNRSRTIIARWIATYL